MADCIFCSIAAGEAPAEIVEEDEYTVAFMDIAPWQPGHALVIPRRHAQDLLEIDPEDLAHVYATAQRVAGRMRSGLGCDGVHFMNSCGAAAGQVVPHFHVHVIPAGRDDPEVPPRRSPPPSEQEISEAAERLRSV